MTSLTARVLGTIGHNRRFSRREYKEYGLATMKADERLDSFNSLLRQNVIDRSSATRERGTKGVEKFYLTQWGHDTVERTLELRSVG